MYIHLDEDLNIQICKMQVNRHTKQKYLCQWLNATSWAMSNLSLGFGNPIYNSVDEMDMILCRDMDMILCSEMYMLLSK